MATGQSFNPQCYPPRMTRAEAMARRTAGTLKENCVVVITDGPTIGVAGFTSPTEIELNPTSSTELGLTARVFTTYDDSAWAGIYDIDLGTVGSITKLTDSSNNTAEDTDPDAPTVHTQFPWHMGTAIGGTWRDNYALDTTFISADTTNIVGAQIRRNTFMLTNMDFTGWLGFNFNDMYIEGFGTHHITGPFANWTSSRIEGSSTVVGQIALGNSTIDAGSNLNAPTIGANARINISGSQLFAATLTTDASTLTVTNSEVRNSTLTNSPGSLKTIIITQSQLENVFFRTDGTGLGALQMTNTHGYGRPVAPGESVLLQGTTNGGGISVTRCEVDWGTTGATPGWVKTDGLAGAGLLANASIIRLCRITQGVAAGAFQIANGCDLLLCTIVANGTGVTSAADARFTMNGTRANGMLYQMLPASTLGNMQISNGSQVNSTVEMTSGPRDLLVRDTDMRGASQAGNYIKQSSVSVGGSGNQVSSCEIIDNARIDFSDTDPAATIGNSVSYSRVSGTTLGGGFGRILIQGTSQSVAINNCEVIDGILTITDDNATTQPATHYYNIRVGQGGTFTVTNPSTVAAGGRRRFRDIYVDGEGAVFSSVNMTGGPDFDISRIKVSPGCQVNFLGAVVAPCQDILIETLSVLNIDSGASVQQWRQGMESIVNTGAFQHFWNVFEYHDGVGFANLPFTCTGPNQNHLKNPGFNNFV